jgi:hypothetical protein
MANSTRLSIHILGKPTVAYLVKNQSHFMETHISSSFLRQPVTEHQNETRESLKKAELDEFVTLALGDDWSASCFGHSSSAHGTHRTGKEVHRTACLD